MAQKIDGKELAQEVRARVAAEAAEFEKKHGRRLGLSVVLVGEDPASQIYVRNKERAAEKAGFRSQILRLSATVSFSDIAATVDRLNEDPEVDGILVQLPLPSGIDAEAITERIDPCKDADGLHPVNLGRLVAGMPGPRPCTPSGVMTMLKKIDISLSGARAVVVGRSSIVGKPMALLLLEKHATVTICHSRTQDLQAEVERADVVVAAVGKPEFLPGSWIKKGATVIDVGINRTPDGLKGDVAFQEAAERAAWITPVPGGVGPMTIAMLLRNTLKAAWQRMGPKE